MSHHMPLQTCCEHHLCDSGAADSHYVWVLCQTFGRATSSETSKERLYRTAPLPGKRLFLSLSVKGNLFPFSSSFSAPESTHIPQLWLCRAALLARLAPVSTSDSKTQEGLYLVPPQTFQGHLESHQTAERRCRLPLFFTLFSQFPPDSVCPAGGCHTWMANGGGGMLGQICAF